MILRKKIFFLMGITASGKTEFALKLSQNYLFEIISVDSVMMYKFFNIGSGKYKNDMLFYKPHYFVDFLFPSTVYTMSDFCIESVNIIINVLSKNRFPLFVGGSIMYFLFLEKGFVFLSNSNLFIKNKLLYLCNNNGFLYLYNRLISFKCYKLLKYQIKDKYRLLRLIEILILTGNFLNNFKNLDKFYILKNFDILKISLFFNKFFLLKKIENRIYEMLKNGFIEEVKDLFCNFNLNKEFPSLKSIGYKQVFFYLSKKMTFDEMVLNINLLTKKLVKNQVTWLKINNVFYLSNYNLYYFLNYICF